GRARCRRPWQRPDRAAPDAGFGYASLSAAQRARVNRIAKRVMVPVARPCAAGSGHAQTGGHGGPWSPPKSWVNGTGRLSVSYGTPGQALLSTLGVLRRQATAADRLPQAIAKRMLLGQARGVYVRSASEAATSWGSEAAVGGSLPVRRQGRSPIASAIGGEPRFGLRAATQP
ncbi:MAG: hypothetical protein ACRDKL_00655, partial [Solirubrobacteraceae bacterium]